MSKHTLRIIAGILAAIALVAMFVLARYHNRIEKMLQTNQAVTDNVINDDLSRLLVERGELKVQLEKLEDEIEVNNDHLGSIVYLITEPRSAVMTQIVPIMDKYKYAGTLAITATQYPGVEGCMTWQDIHTLLDKGWDLCVSADDIDDVDMLTAIFEKTDIEMPKTVYYPKEECSIVDEQIWLSEGFENVVVYDGETVEPTEGRLWRLAAYGSNQEDSQITTKTYFAESKPLVLTVGFSYSREAFSVANFEGMMSAITNYVSAGKVNVTTVSGAKKRYIRHLENLDSKDSSKHQQMEEMELRIEELDKEIDELRKTQN